MSDLLNWTQSYINYEEKKLVEEVVRSKQSHKGNDNKRHDDDL